MMRYIYKMNNKIETGSSYPITYETKFIYDTKQKYFLKSNRNKTEEQQFLQEAMKCSK
jgi:hypothetical protein